MGANSYYNESRAMVYASSARDLSEGLLANRIMV